MARKMKRYDEGGDVNEEFARPIKSTEDATSETAEAPAKKSFKAAFAEARKAGDKTFEWEGKKYTTEMAAPKKAAAKSTDESSSTQNRLYKIAQEAGANFARASNALRDLPANVPEATRAAMTKAKDKLESEYNVRTYAAKGAKGMKSGGSVGSASKRADGIAQRGKTKGKVY